MITEGELVLKRSRWEKIAVQDLVLLLVGAVLFAVTFIGVLGLNGLFTLALGVGFMGIATFDLGKLFFKEEKPQINRSTSKSLNDGSNRKRRD